MIYEYFIKSYENIEDIKRHYRELMKQFHPDHEGGSVEAAQKINAEYSVIIQDFVSDIFRKKKEENTESGFDYSEDDIFIHAEIIRKIIHLDNITIEIIGTWIYVFNSYLVKDYLKDLGFWFSSKYKAWVFNNGTKKKIWSKKTLEEIRETHGSQTVKKENQKRIA